MGNNFLLETLIILLICSAKQVRLAVLEGGAADYYDFSLKDIACLRLIQEKRTSKWCKIF